MTSTISGSFLYRAYPSLKLIDLLNPREEDIELKDIVWHLSNNNRWLGASAKPISIAAHSILVEIITTEILKPKGFDGKTQSLYRFYALSHDWAEAYLGDMTNPLKRLIRQYTSVYDEFEDMFMRVIYNRFSIPYELRDYKVAFPDEIKIADTISRIVESETLRVRSNGYEEYISFVEKEMSPEYREIINMEFFIDKENTLTAILNDRKIRVYMEVLASQLMRAIKEG